MADIVDKAEFWLPIAEDDVLVHDQVLGKYGVARPFPPDFSPRVDSFPSSPALNSPVEPMPSPRSEAEVAQESLFAELARQLARSAIHETQKLAAEEKTWILSGSPKSTLSALGSWAGTPTAGPSRKTSPAATPQSRRSDGWDVVYAAAAQVARLKMARERSKYQQSRGLLGQLSGDLSSFPPKKPAPGFYPNQILTHSANQHLQNLRQAHAMEQQIQQSRLQQQQIQSRVRAFGQESGMLPQSAFPPLQPPQHRPGSAAKAVFPGGGSGGGRKESAGTGVFLPRRYGNATDSRKKPGNSSVLLPGNMISPAPQSYSNNSASVPDYDSLMMARKRALFVEQQKRSVVSDMTVSSEIRLPQEWTY